MTDRRSSRRAATGGPSSQSNVKEAARVESSGAHGSLSIKSIEPGISQLSADTRESLTELAAKEQALARIMDQHDTLLREQFHLERYVTMIRGYDPVLVKQDASPVFEDWRRPRDLWTLLDEETATGAVERPESSSSASARRSALEGGHARSTRKRTANLIEKYAGYKKDPKATTEDAEVQGQSQMEQDSAQETKTPHSPSSRKKIRRRDLVSDQEGMEVGPHPTTPSLSKRSGRARVAQGFEASPKMSESSTRNSKRKINEDASETSKLDSTLIETSRSAQQKAKAKGNHQATLIPESNPEDSPGRGRSKATRKKEQSSGRQKTTGKAPLETSTDNPIKQPSKKRKLPIVDPPSQRSEGRPDIEKEEPRHRKTRRRSSRSHDNKAEEMDNAVTVPPFDPYADVRGMIPRWTCPEQLVEGPVIKPQESERLAVTPDAAMVLRKYLDSYRSVDDLEYDGRDLAKLETQIRTSAYNRNRIRQLQAAGRLLPDLAAPTDAESSSNEQSEGRARSSATASAAPFSFPRLQDQHQLLVHDAIQVRQLLLNYSRHRQAECRKIAKIIQMYWELESTKEERTRRRQERQYRLAAKAMLKELKSKWKEAVKIITMRKQAEEELERQRLGKEQLEAILLRSSELLQQQKNRATSEETDSEGEYLQEDEAAGAVDPEIPQAADSEEPFDESLSGTGTDGDDLALLLEYRQSSPARSEADEGASEGTQMLLGPPPTEEAANRRKEDDILTNVQPVNGGDFAPTPPTKSPALDVEMTATQGSKIMDPPIVQVADTDTNLNAPFTVYEPGTEDQDTTLTEPVRQSGRLAKKRSTAKPYSHPIKTEDDPDQADEEYRDAGNSNDAVQDSEMDLAMEQEDAAAGEDAEENEGLAKDADLPLEKLLKQYGYTDEAIAEIVKSKRPHKPSDRPPVEKADASVRSELERQSKPEDVQIDEGDVEDEQEIDSASAEATEAPETDFPVPFLLRAKLRPYQLTGLEWLANAYKNRTNAILADEMGLGKTIQTIALLAHLACDHGIWGSHLVIVPTSVILNWEMEFRKFLPGFKVLTYYGTQEERKKKRKGWALENAFQVCITSYQLVIQDQLIFRRRKWHYLILDEAHNIKNFRSQKWQTLLGFNSERRLLLTGTPLQNNLMELWSLLYFLMPQGFGENEGGFANHLEFNEWFSNPVDSAISRGDTVSDETRATISRLHIILRPYVLRRLKSEVEKQLPGKREEVVYCKLSNRQRQLYDEFMSRKTTKQSLASGGYFGVANVLMQLRKVCNHPDLFEVRPIRTSFAMSTSLLQACRTTIWAVESLDKACRDPRHPAVLLQRGVSSSHTLSTRRRLDPLAVLLPTTPEGDEPFRDTRTIDGWKTFYEAATAAAQRSRLETLAARNTFRCRESDCMPTNTIEAVRLPTKTSVPLPLTTEPLLDKFAFVTPNAVAPDLAQNLVPNSQLIPREPDFDNLHNAAVKLQIAFPDRSLVQYDCGKLQVLAPMLKRLKAQGHRVVIFTQMTRMLDILEIFLNLHGHTYSRLDGSTKIEDRLILTERFNATPKIFAFIASTRSGGVGINLTGADTVIFYDSEYNPAMDRQAQDRAHRIGQTREVTIYRMVTLDTVEENIYRTAQRKILLDDMVIQQGNFTTDFLARTNLRDVLGAQLFSDAEKSDGDIALTSSEMQCALAQAEDEEDVDAAKMAARENIDVADFGEQSTLDDQSRRSQSVASEDKSTPNEVPNPVTDTAEHPSITLADADVATFADALPLNRFMVNWVELDWETMAAT